MHGESNIYLLFICIMHYIYGKPEVKKNKKIPVCFTTFGEIAHILLNQTLVHLSVHNI